MLESPNRWIVSLTSLADILHNIADHAQALLLLLNDQSVTPEFINRINDHIFFEEQENTSKLQELQNGQPTAIIQKLLDHSYLIQQMTRQPSMSVGLKRELLDHFTEEHQAWMAEVASNSDSRQWTVGPLWP